MTARTPRGSFGVITTMRFICESSVRRLPRLLAFTIAWALGVALHSQDQPLDRRAAIEEIYPVMIASLEAKNFARARNLCEQVILWEPQNPLHHYNLACIEAQVGGPRLAHALGALELSLTLGFNDAEHMQADPDLIPLRTHPRFPDLVRKAMHNASANEAIAAIPIPPPPVQTPPAASPPAESDEKPAPASFAKDVPVGLYYMTRYHSVARTLEQGVWYFSPEGTVYRNLGFGFSAHDLSAHPGLKGKAAAAGSKLEITWKDGTKNVANLERDEPDFTWDMALFSPVAAFLNASDLLGIYQGGDQGGAVAAKLEIREDGSFIWDGVTLVGPPATAALEIKPGLSSKGTWKLEGLSLTLTDEKGHRFRRLVFPSDDSRTIIKPDRMFFDGSMYRKLP